MRTPNSANFPVPCNCDLYDVFDIHWDETQFDTPVLRVLGKKQDIFIPC